MMRFKPLGRAALDAAVAVSEQTFGGSFRQARVPVLLLDGERFRERLCKGQ